MDRIVITASVEGLIDSGDTEFRVSVPLGDNAYANEQLVKNLLLRLLSEISTSAGWRNLV